MNNAVQDDPGVARRRGLGGVTMILVMAALAAADTLYGRAGDWRVVDFARVGAILLIALILSLRTTSAFSFHGRDRRLDDELTRANRMDAARWGFWALFCAVFLAFVASFFAALRLSDIAPMVLVVGAAAAGWRFVTLERRGE